MPELSKIPSKYKNKKIYSYSKLSTFHNCQYGYYLNYILHKENKQNIYGYLGGCIHEMLEKAQINEMTKEEMLHKFDDYLLEANLSGYKFPSLKVENSYKKAIKHYLSMYKPIKSKKCIMEKELYYELKNDIVIRMFLDLTTLNEDGTISIYDYKTSTKYTKKELLDKGRQLIIYGLGIEQNFPKYKIKGLYWDMLKYINVKYGKRDRMLDRNKLIEKLENDIRKKLDKIDMDDIEIEMLIEQSIDDNNFESLPSEIKNTYTFKRSFVNYPFSKQLKEEAKKYIYDTVEEIENKDINNENEWKPKNITEKDNFFCSTLCGCRDNCKYYKEFLNNNKDNFKKIELDKQLFDENLFE